MRNPLVAALLLTVVSAAPGLAQTVERFSIKGAQDAIVVPKDWNGSLFIYAHGYTADKVVLDPIPEDVSKANQLLLPALVSLAPPDLLFVPKGYASAVTSFRSVGWYVKDAVKDIENLRRYFVKKYGKPKRTYLWGHSGGGMVTETVIEYFPHTYEGAAPMCGPGAGARRNFDGAFDLRALYEFVCRDVAEARFVCRVCADGQSRCLVNADCPAGQTCGTSEAPPAPEDGLTAACTDFLLAHPERFDESTGGDFVKRPREACFGGATPTPEQSARRDLYLRASQIPESFLASVLFFASVGIAEIVHRRTNGKHPWGNVGVAYASPRLTADEAAAFNAGVYRADSDPAAVRYLRGWYEPRGRTASKVITVHALDDGLVVPENEHKYREAFEAAGRTDQLVQFNTPSGGHCLFLGAWRPALEALTAWVEHGQVPTSAALDAACANCLTQTSPGVWGERVIERKQKGAPVRTLVCSAAPGDCPTGSVCVAQKHRCQ